jgi:hypothetical protein
MRALVEDYVQSNMEEFEAPPETPAPRRAVGLCKKNVGSPAAGSPCTPRSARRGKSKPSTPQSSVKKSKKKTKQNLVKARHPNPRASPAPRRAP